jgi:hypothetical protein
MSALTACGDDDGGVDGGGTDGGVIPVDAGMDGSAIPPDGGFDGGFDAGFDAGAPDGGPVTPEGCNPDGGIECDGDWTGRCMATCGVGECCSPQGGRFECVARDTEGNCPAADIWVDEERINSSSVDVEWQYFEADDCAIVEGCVDAAGWRRLMRFPTWTPNTGGADLFLGRPADMASYFEYSSCHGHYHFNSYAQYELEGADGSVVATGHKQAFCLLDYYQYPGTDGRGAVYNCSNQGIQRDWQDVYGQHLDCQWVDVTDVEPGDYTLRIDVNFDHILNESDYTNNTASVTVTVPPDTEATDVTMACATVTSSADRDCGLTREAVHSCTPGATVSVGCSSVCGLGSCTGDPFIRVCAASDDPGCTGRRAIASNDDSGCGAGACTAGDCCSRTSFTCPAGGSYVVFYGPYRSSSAATCTIATM